MNEGARAKQKFYEVYWMLLFSQTLYYSVVLSNTSSLVGDGDGGIASGQWNTWKHVQLQFSLSLLSFISVFGK